MCSSLMNPRGLFESSTMVRYTMEVIGTSSQFVMGGNWKQELKSSLDAESHRDSTLE